MTTESPAEYVDPYDAPEYHAYVAECAKHCRCAAQFTPCDSCLAGGICDEIREPQDEPDYDRDYDDDEI